MTERTVAKYHALGNDYIVVDPKYLDAPMTEENIRIICDRNYGVGSDGILYGPLVPDDSTANRYHTGGQPAQKAEDAGKQGGQEAARTPSYVMPLDSPKPTPQVGPYGQAGEPFRVRIFNPDGSEAEKSGNGLRIFAKYLADTGYTGDRTAFDVLTKGGLAHITLLNPEAELVEVDMGTASFFSRDIPAAGEPRDMVDEEILLDGVPYRVTCLTVGNPHCVMVVDTVSKELAHTLGPVIENHPLFPNRVNMQIVQILNRNAIKIEIWERGAGYTLASGSSSCAAVAAAYRLGLTDEQVSVTMPGGGLGIRMEKSGRILMRGPVSSVFEAELTTAFLHVLNMR